MALIGPMKYLTIGESTYEIQGQEITSSAITSALGYTPYNGSTNPNGYITSFTDEKLKTTAVTSGTTYYPIVGSNSTTAANKNYDSTGFSYAGTNGTANGTNGNALLTLGNNTASTSVNWKKGTLRLYGTSSSYTDIVSAVTTTARTITLPNATGTVALTSDIPTVPTNVSAFTNDAGYITSDTNVTSTAVTTYTTNYLVGSTSSSTTTGTLSKHASAYIVTSSDSVTNGNTTLSLGNDTAVTSAGGKSGRIQLFSSGTGGVVLSSETTSSSTLNGISFPAKSGTVALISDIPTVPTNISAFTNDVGYVTSDSDEKLKTNEVSNSSTYYPIFGSDSTTASTKYYSTNFRVQNSSTDFYLNLGRTNSKNGTLQLIKGAYFMALTPTVLTASRSITLPDNSGTVALTSNIPSAGNTATAITHQNSSGGSATTWSRSDHVHNITSTIIGSAGGVTGVKINGTTYSPTSGTVDLGTISSTAAQIIRW